MYSKNQKLYIGLDEAEIYIISLLLISATLNESHMAKLVATVAEFFIALLVSCLKHLFQI